MRRRDVVLAGTRAEVDAQIGAARLAPGDRAEVERFRRYLRGEMGPRERETYEGGGAPSGPERTEGRTVDETKLIGEDTRERLRRGEAWDDDCGRLLAVIERGEELLASAERERDEARAVLAAAARGEAPTCVLCKAVATQSEADGARACDAHAGDGWHDLPYAAAVRAAMGSPR